MKNYKYRMVIAAISLLAIQGCGEKYLEKSAALNEKVIQILIDKKVCANSNECNSREYVLGEGGSRVYINVYGISDKKVVGKIVQIVAEDGIQIVEGVPIRLQVFSHQKKDTLGLFWRSEDPYLTLEVKPNAVRNRRNQN